MREEGGQEEHSRAHNNTPSCASPPISSSKFFFLSFQGTGKILFLSFSTLKKDKKITVYATETTKPFGIIAIKITIIK